MFENREQAGQLLADRLLEYKNRTDVIVFAIPRGGVVVAKVVANSLGVPLDIVVIKKIGAPDNQELAIGAVGPDNCVYCDRNLFRRLEISKFQISNLKFKIENERKQREKILRGRKRYPSIEDKTVILVDDGVATGATAIVASLWVKKMNSKEIILAIPVIAKSTLSNISKYFDRIIFLEQPEEFYAVGEFYQDFPQVSDEEVIQLL